jgi:ArsR family transcriptional regulator, virulence genes transcriptional regulator
MYGTSHKKKRKPRVNYTQKAAAYKMLSHLKRLEIIDTLLNGEMSVNAIADVLNITKSRASQHLNMIRRTGLVDGYRVYYSLAAKKIATVWRMKNRLWKQGLLSLWYRGVILHLCRF